MNIVTIITGTVIIIIFSWFFTLRYGRYHGIPRFFSFESIFLLVLLSIPVWFRSPFSVKQLISWIFLILSAWAGLAGFITLKRRGRPEGNFENTSNLVRTGIYSLIRHPLYFSLFCLGTGAMMKNPEPPSLLLGLINGIAVYITARIEEKEMIEKFGDQYREYIKETRMFIPYIL
jgi:protein-S-isoprenylcysteine O-methyltransferase Ste14